MQLVWGGLQVSRQLGERRVSLWRMVGIGMSVRPGTGSRQAVSASGLQARREMS